jgi:hypothetical protein
MELRLGLRPGLLGRTPAGERLVGGHEGGDLRRDDQADPASPEIRQRDDGVAPVGLVCEASGPLARVDLTGGDAGARYDNSNSASISTGMSSGSDPIPTALRTPMPFSCPQISANNSLQPLIT